MRIGLWCRYGPVVMRRSLVVLAAGVAVGLALPVPAALADSGSSSLSGGTGSASGSGGSGSGGSKPSQAQWLADIAPIAAAAQSYLTTAIPGATKPAIVFDIDNTVLETSYNPQPIIPAIPAILAVAQYAKSQGASVFYVTGRPSLLNVYSQANLLAVGYPVDGVYGAGPTTGSSGAAALASYKTATRASIQGQGYTIVANIGNSDSDLSGGYALQTFKLPDYNGALN